MARSTHIAEQGPQSLWLGLQSDDQWDIPRKIRIAATQGSILRILIRVFRFTGSIPMVGIDNVCGGMEQMNKSAGSSSQIPLSQTELSVLSVSSGRGGKTCMLLTFWLLELYRMQLKSSSRAGHTCASISHSLLGCSVWLPWRWRVRSGL